jgi:hypothetical protein
MHAWKEYQEQAATFFRSLGLKAATDERVIGVRGVHDIDVAVRSETAGIGQLWIVECKRWKRRVEKLHVAALYEIVQDVGADRGILLSEVGFQAGAIRMANSSNITLSSLADLEENSEGERARLALVQLRRRISILIGRIGKLTTREDRSPQTGGTFTRITYGAVPGVDMRQVTQLYGKITMVQFGLSSGEAERYPFSYTLQEKRVMARTAGELVATLDMEVTDIENQISSMEAAARDAV